MSLLSPWSALFAAAIALPLLVLLYFLKLRRQRLSIASTLLWRKSFEDLSVNAPFQKMRWSLLLVLQLLALIALLLALAQPVARGDSPSADRVVMVIDAGASMNARLADGRTRLEAARTAAKGTVQRLSRSAQVVQFMVVAFGSSARLVSGYESNRDVIGQAIDSIAGSDEESNLEAGLQLAGAYAGQRDEASEPAPDVMLFSDGDVAAPKTSTGYSLRGGRFRYAYVGPAVDEPVSNIGFVSVGATRDDEDPSQVRIFGRLINAGPSPADVVVTVSADGEPVTAIRRTIPAATDLGPGEEAVSASLLLPGDAVLSLHQNLPDQLAADDEALLVMPAPAKPRVLLVYPEAGKPDEYLLSMLQELDTQSLVQFSKPAFDGLDAQRIHSGAVYDLIIFDRVSPVRHPGVSSISFGVAPPGVKVIEHVGDINAGRQILSWDRQDPVMRHVSLDTVVYSGFGAFDLPSGAKALALGPQGPVIAQLRAKGVRHIAVGFELVNSNWPLHVSSAVFLQNAVEFLTQSKSGRSGLAFRPGEPITVRALPNAGEVAVTGPVSLNVEAQSASASNGGGAAITIPALPLAGLYEVHGAAPPHDRLALSVLSDVASDIRPRRSLTVNAEIEQGAVTSAAGARELWPWLAGAAMLLLAVEWIVWCRRVGA